MNIERRMTYPQLLTGWCGSRGSPAEDAQPIGRTPQGLKTKLRSTLSSMAASIQVKTC